MFPTTDVLPTLPVIISNTKNGVEPSLQHRLLFEGDLHGLGKTTLARCIASDLNDHISEEERERIYNGIDCNTVKFRNAGSYRKLENARELEDEIESYRRVLDPGTRYFIIIDEIHRMVPAAISALLQPFENIPNNLYIIATTTDIDALRMDMESGRENRDGEAFLSRFTTCHFQPLTKPQTVSMLMDIASQENVSVFTESVAEQIHDLTGGVPRDSVKIMQKFLTFGILESITEKTHEAISAADIIYVMLKVPFDQHISWYRDVVPRISTLTASINGGEARTELIKALGHYMYSTKGLEDHESLKSSSAETRASRTGIMVQAIRRLFDAVEPVISYPPKTILTGRLLCAFQDLKNLSAEPK